MDSLSPIVLFLLVVLPLFAVFFMTASRGRPYHIDPFSNVAPAWKLGTTGSLYLDEYAEFTAPEYWRSVGWFVAVDDTAVSKYPPGTALWAAPFYAVGPNDAELIEVRPTNERAEFDTVEILIPPLTPAAAAAALSVALALGFLALTVSRTVGPRLALAAAYVAGLGTSAWGVAADSLWQHGPAMMWIALGGLLVAAGNAWGSGVAYGFGVLTRPPTALMGAGATVGTFWDGRRWGDAMRLAAGIGLGLAAVVGYNSVVFGSASISGGYESGLIDSALSLDFSGYLGNVFRAFVDPRRGMLVWSPFLIVLAGGLVTGWRHAPKWARGAAIGGLLYLLLQLKANRFSGGEGFVGYRYPLEPLVAAAPLLVLSYREWVAKHRLRRVAFMGTAAIAFGLQLIAALS